MAYIFLSFAVQCLLCVIFMQLSTPTEIEEDEFEEENNEIENRLSEIEIEASNNEAELQAKLWNQFMQNRQS